LAEALLPVRGGDALRAAALAVVYAAVAAASLRWLDAPEVGAIVWPAAGVALAALTVGGTRLWPGVLVGQLATAAAMGRLPGAGDLILAAGATLAAAAPALAFRRLKLHPNLDTLGSMLWLAFGGALGASLWIGAGLGAHLAQGGAPQTFGAVAQIWWFGHLAAVLTVTPAALSWRPFGGQVVGPRAAAHLALTVAVNALLAYAIFLWPGREALRSWFIFPALVWPALVFSIRGASLALLVVAGAAVAAALQGTGPLTGAAGASPYTAYTQQFVAIVSLTVLILAAVADERRGREQLRVSEQRLREESEALDVLNRTGAAIAAELDLDTAVRLVTDAGVSLSGARFGAFFYNVTNEAGESYMLFALSGAPREAFERFGQPRNTAIFAPTFAGEGVVRSDDITNDPRYGGNPPHRGMPAGHPPVRSYLAAPVRSRSGEVIGGLFFGHPDAGVFTARAERLVVGVAAQAAIAIDNARLYQAAQRELAERRRAEEHQRLLMNELNHRVKNTLATVQSMGSQTLRTGRSVAEAREAFVTRLLALSAAHDLLTSEHWESADLEDVVCLAITPFEETPRARFEVEGPGVRLPAPHALGLAMALHELGSNAAKYGALSAEAGKVRVAWTLEPEDTVRFVWEERDGPPVAAPPVRRGFGSRLIQEGLARELRGEVRMDYLPGGLRCELCFRLKPVTPPDDPAADFEDPAPPGL
jgi:two-component sensor histidine kinase/integral membrane sensor domain MASE1